MGKKYKTKKIKICLVVNSMFFVVTQLLAQLRALAEMNYEIIILTSSDNLDERLRVIPNIRLRRIDIKRKISIFSDLKAIFQIYNVLKNNKVDISHSITPKAGLLTSIAARMACVNVRLHTFTGQHWFHAKSLKRKIYIFAEKIIVSLNTACLTDSRAQVKVLIENGIVSSEKNIKVLGRGSLAGIDLDRFDISKKEYWNKAFRKINNFSNEDKLIMYIGRINDDKGIASLVYDFIDQTYEDNEKYKLVLVGPIEKEFDKLGKNIIDIKGRVIHFPTNFHIEEILSSANVLVLPSYREGFGSVVLEAYALGIPVVARDIYGFKNSIFNGKTGLKFSKGGGISEVKKILSDTKLREKLVSNGFEIVKKEFTCLRISILLDKFYKQELLK